MNCSVCGRFMRIEFIETDGYNKQDITWWRCENHKPVFIKPECKDW